jgi:PAS domain S-box-containing protein
LINAEGQILVLNQSATALGGYTNEEICGSHLKALFPYLIGQEKSTELLSELPDHSLETILLTRKKDRLPVTMRCIEINNLDVLHLITFETIAESQRRHKEKQRRSLILTNFKRLFKASEKSDPFSAILDVGSKLLITNVLTIYLCENDSPIFRKIATWGDANLFPNEIPPTDLQQLFKPSLWISGKRSIVTILHQAVRVAQYAYLATAPIGEPGAWTGVIVASGLEEPDPENTLPILQILAVAIALHLQQHLSNANLESNLKTLANKVTVGDTICESIQEGTILVSPKFQILELNSAAEYILGYANHEIHGQPVENVLIGTDRLLPALRLAMQGVPTPNLGKITLHRRDGSSFSAIIQTTPVSKKQEILGALVIFQDISEHEQIKIRTQQLEQRALLGEVTAVFAHEVRNPINKISTGLQLMALNTPEEDTETQELIARLQHDCNRLTDLMESILTFSRTGNYRFIPIDVQIVLEKLLMRWRPRLERLNIKHHVQVAADTRPIMGDQRALEQVFTNLISNAVRAMGENGGILAIRIATQTAPSGKLMTQIDISDTGPGIPEEIRERIFDPFFTTDPNGTGLGLSITKQIITAHKGSIYPTSFPGGTVFHVQIPALEDAEEQIL